jgi:hypothetical protein
MESDTFVFSWITGADEEDIMARSGDFTTPVLRDPEISEMVCELEREPSPLVKDPAQDMVRRSRLDWILESVDSPTPLPPVMQSRVLKALDIARADMWVNKKKRY